MILDGRQLRLRRLVGDGRAVVIAIDHGLFDGPIPGMENLPETAAKINPAVDAVLLSPGMLRHCHGVFARLQAAVGRGAAQLEHGVLFRAGLLRREERLHGRAGRRTARRDGHCPGLVDLADGRRGARRGERRGLRAAHERLPRPGDSGDRRVFSDRASEDDARAVARRRAVGLPRGDRAWARTRSRRSTRTTSRR